MVKKMIVPLILVMLLTALLPAFVIRAVGEPASLSAASGNALLVTSRSSTVSSHKQDITSVLSASGPGTYYLAAWVKLSGATASDTFNQVLLVQGTSTTYPGTGAVTVNNTSFTRVYATINITWTGTLQSAFVYASTGTNAAYIIDGITLNKFDGTNYGNNLFTNGDMESVNGLTVNSWTNNNTATLLLSNSNIDNLPSLSAASGNVLSVTARGDVYSSHKQDITATLNTYGAGKYYLACWVKLSGTTATDTFNQVLSVQGTTTTYPQTGNFTVNNTSYTRVYGIIDISWTGTLQKAFVYAATGTRSDYLVDGVTLNKITATTTSENLFVNGNMESTSGLTVLSWTANNTATLSVPLDYLQSLIGTPSGNAFVITRGAPNDGPRQFITSILNTRGQGNYYLNAWVKLKDATTDTQEFRLAIQLNTSGGTKWYTTPYTTLNTASYTLVTAMLNITWTGTLTDAFIYVDSKTNGVQSGSKFPYYFDNCSFRQITNPLSEELLTNPQCEYDVFGNVAGWTTNGYPTISYSIPFAPEIQATVNGDGSISYANGFVPATDANIRYLGRWEKQSDNSYNGYFESSMEFKFTGSTIALRLAGSTNNMMISIDGGSYTKYSSVVGTIILADGTLGSGEHTMKVFSGFQKGWPKIAGFIIGAGEKSVPPAAIKKMEIIGDSITVGYVGTGHVNSLTSAYGFKSANMLGFSSNTIAFGGITLVPGGGSPDTTGMTSRYFKMGEMDSVAQNTTWDTSKYTPDYIVIDLGTNDLSSDAVFQSNYISFLESLRTCYPDAVIFAMTPFKNKYVSAISNAVNTRSNAGDDKVVFIDASTWITSAQTTDGTHPTEEGHDIIAQNLTAAIQDYLDSIAQYTVSFLNEDESPYDTVTAVNGHAITAPAEPTKTNYVFAGWFKEADCTNQWDFATDTVTENISLHPKWIMMGDLNHNGSISAFDALLALQISSGKITPNEDDKKAADVNKSGGVSSIDALRILQFSSGKITIF